ncbi:nitrate reductase associated protein [Ferruginibacter paludis]|uniref:nitrate reductase associated protein n=1 Tax=Ferruginibacter paludis TaxID=1310417 RepID=UPI0025B3CE65|nr:nitrate reductase associated protein [Ferruginibacter paludis]MDN3654327.1 nitrate reductase associated protein [Ferruginibacter paludis]
MSATNTIQRWREMQGLFGVEYFLFEEDFVEANVRCIPMVVRFKLDAVGIKLPLELWCKFSVKERKTLAVLHCKTPVEKERYHCYLNGLVNIYSGTDAKPLAINPAPLWANLENVPEGLQQKAAEFNWFISVKKWGGLSNLQRFALLKLFSPGHENRNFPKAMKEFGLAIGFTDLESRGDK